MLDGLLSKEKVVNYLYGEMKETSHLRDRVPAPMEWSVAKCLVRELEYPCKVVVKSQDKGHWLLSDAMHRMACLYQHLQEGLKESEDTINTWQHRFDDEAPGRYDRVMPAVP